MAEREKRDKKNYLRDFEEKPDGSYVYTGKTWHADEAVRRRILGKLWALQAVMLFSVFLDNIFLGFYHIHSTRN